SRGRRIAPVLSTTFDQTGAPAGADSCTRGIATTCPDAAPSRPQVPGIVPEMEDDMERLYFECPKTGQEVDVGIETELGTLLRIRQRTVRARCPACGEQHEWQVRDAKLSNAA